jgi:poly(3-hydroxybutyrate) depolymerase
VTGKRPDEMRMLKQCFLVSLAIVICIPSFAKAKVVKQQVEYQGNYRVFYRFIPDKDGPLPLIVLVHGSFRNGWVMADSWKSLAEREGFMIAAPDSSNDAGWTLKDDPPDLLHLIVTKMSEEHSLDKARVFLFGHSAGARYALDLALVDSAYYTAVAIHAGALEPRNYNLFANVSRKVPIAIWTGRNDRIVPVQTVVTTKEPFEAHGFPVRLSIIPNHDHTYEEVDSQVNSAAWAFFQTSEPKSAALSSGTNEH